MVFVQVRHHMPLAKQLCGVPLPPMPIKDSLRLMGYKVHNSIDVFIYPLCHRKPHRKRGQYRVPVQYPARGAVYSAGAS